MARQISPMRTGGDGRAMDEWMDDPCFDAMEKQIDGKCFRG